MKAMISRPELVSPKGAERGAAEGPSSLGPACQQDTREDGMLDAGSAHWPSRGPRELFPLPKFAMPLGKPGCCRSVRKRWDRIRRRVGDVNDVIGSLNWMAGCSDEMPWRPASPMQQEVLDRLDGLVSDQQPKGVLPSPEEALRALLHGSAPYDWRPANETLASYQAELVSIPDSVHDCPFLTQVVPTDDLRYLGEKSEQILKPARDLEQSEHVKPYWEPKLRYNRKAYHGLVKKLHDIGYFEYTTKPAATVGVFFVWKSSRTKLRMITDARLANQYFKAPPSVSMLSSEGFGRIEVTFSAKAQSRMPEDAIEAFIGISDVRDCFHRMKVPRWLSRYFAWEPIPAKVVGLSNTVIDGIMVGPLDPIWPCAGSLCQGWTWSLYFAQRANEQLCSSSRLLREARLASDRGPNIVLNVEAGLESSDHFYVYVDNLGVLGLNREAALEELHDKFNGLGLHLHKSEVGSDRVEALGCVIDGRRLRSSITPQRLWKLRQAITGLLRHRRVSGRAVEVLVGHLTFCGLMARPALSIFSACYAFIQASYDKASPLWVTVRRELLAFRGVLLLLNQDWWRPWNRLVSSSDSSLSGYGVCQAWWPLKEVQKAGRVSERLRFRRVGPHSARESSLQAAGFVRSGDGWRPAGDALLEQLGDAGWDPKYLQLASGVNFGLRRCGENGAIPRRFSFWKLAPSSSVSSAF